MTIHELHRRRLLLVALFSCLGLACRDAAKPDYELCLEWIQAGDVLTAASACERAISVDSESTSGKAAQAQLTSMQESIQIAQEAARAAAEAERIEAERRREAERLEAQRRQEEARIEAERKRRERFSYLIGKITLAYYDKWSKDRDCLGRGLPPYLIQFNGGTYEENDELAKMIGCKSYAYLGQCCPQSYWEKVTYESLPR